MAVKIRDKRRALDLLGTLPSNRALRNIKDSYERKGVLSKREIKVLFSMAPDCTTEQRAEC